MKHAWLIDTIVPPLTLNRHGPVIFIQPETGDDLADHTCDAKWMGEVVPLDVSVFRH